MSTPPIRVPAIAAQPFSTELQLPTPRPVASPAGPADAPLSPPPAAAPYVPPPAPDHEAPISTHRPDGS
jgi:hypothetical protein